MEQKKYNAFAIAGFVCSFFVSIVGLVLSIIGFNQIKRTGEQGRGMAIAGIAISCASIGIAILALIISIIGIGVFSLKSVDTTSTASRYTYGTRTQCSKAYSCNERYDGDYNCRYLNSSYDTVTIICDSSYLTYSQKY